MMNTLYLDIEGYDYDDEYDDKVNDYDLFLWLVD